ncbi:hypothetical protein [Deinococcus sp. 12RED42]|uniref:hypothetical protein n=1 Tax=Deinococcus sp. 12RED42 TaxID=2745872 RepID=UPI001E2969B8|nr:hypothetical protein [Deinococcus sp. 12RED42]MCD0167181.1 hypothetical protein [Deinococcus sp. 12RED42]
MKRVPEDRLLPYLMTVELAVLGVYGAHPELTDAQVDSAFEELMRRYRAEATNHLFRPGKLDGLRAEVHDAALRNLTTMLEQPGEHPGAEELRLGLGRLRSSVKTWTREAGRQGYLRYIEQYVNAGDGDFLDLD